MNDYLEEVEALPMKEQRRAIRKKENSIVQKIVLTLSLVFVVILIIVGITFWNFWQNGQKPLDTSDTKTELVEIPLGSSNKQIANILEKEKIIKSALVFNYYMKLNNQSGFQAGFYQLSPSMTLDQIAKKMKDGDMEVQTVAIPEGYSAEQIAEAVEKSTPYTAKEFLAVLSDEAYFKKLLADFPELLTSASEASDERYKLEGYLFPATYTLTPGSDVEGLVTQMVNKSNDVLSQYYSVMTEKGLTVHQVLTLASLVEKEGVHDEDRRNIAQVFFNRLAADMPLQSDISVLYALNEHKTLLTIEDTKVDSPYNLYINKGYGPGPFDSPSEDAIKAVLYPNANSYYYFVADVDTGAVYFAETLEEHNALVDKYVNK
ncbi:endolytic transglycosylase MltG [Enterococcus nangangensis]